MTIITLHCRITFFIHALCNMALIRFVFFLSSLILSSPHHGERTHLFYQPAPLFSVSSLPGASLRLLPILRLSDTVYILMHAYYDVLSNPVYYLFMFFRHLLMVPLS